MILVCESDAGTVVAAPRLNTAGDQVVLDVFTNGERTDCQSYPLADWPDRLDEMTDDGFHEETGHPDLKVVLDTTARTLRIAGSVDNHLVDPDTGTDDDPVDPLIEQADDMLATAGTDHGYLRVSNWWNDGGGRLTAVMIPTRQSEVDLEVVAVTRLPLERALRAIRDRLAPPFTDPVDVAAWVELCGDPLEKGFGNVVRRLQAEQTRRRGARTMAASGLGGLYSAISQACLGDAAGAVEEADNVLRLLGVEQ